MKILVIQTAFIGDAILATPVLEKLHKYYPQAEMDLLVRKGNEALFTGHPFLHRVIVWDKKHGKLKNLLTLAFKIKKNKYDKAINLHRFASSGLIMFLSGVKERIGFDKNPFSFCYTQKVKHEIGNGKHEVERNIQLIESITDNVKEPPILYPRQEDKDAIKKYTEKEYITIAPSSVWFTKQYPADKWVDFINRVGEKYVIYLLGGGADMPLCEEIKQKTKEAGVVNLAGKLSFLQTAALMNTARMNYVNDSAPMHIASSVNAPVVAVFCSTIPAFGFGPLSSKSFIIETEEKLDCRPCGLHGYKTCPKQHFRCAKTISTEQLLDTLKSA